jgi:hypothetical protein
VKGLLQAYLTWQCRGHGVTDLSDSGGFAIPRHFRSETLGKNVLHRFASETPWIGQIFGQTTVDNHMMMGCVTSDLECVIDHAVKTSSTTITTVFLVFSLIYSYTLLLHYSGRYGKVLRKDSISSPSLSSPSLISISCVEPPKSLQTLL